MDALNHLFTYSVINYWSQIIGNWGFGSKSFIPWPQGAHTFVYQWRVSWEQDLFCLNISQDDIFTAWIHFNRLALFCALWKRGQVVFITREVELLWKWGKAVYWVRKAMLEWVGCLSSTVYSGITGPIAPAFWRYICVLFSYQKRKGRLSDSWWRAKTSAWDLSAKISLTGCANLRKTQRLILRVTSLLFWGFLGGPVVNNPPANAGDGGLIPGMGRSPGGNGYPL